MKVKLGPDLLLDVDSLIDTRLLIQANSGGGKSFAIRKLLEETHGKVQQIILDIEGDFASLREKLDYILAAKNGDIPVSTKSASMLALKVLELRADIIIDLYELKQHERITFVKLFLEAMINAPKNLWHPCLVVVDEAHIFAPEKSRAESMGAVIDLMTRGRKRGFCGILATQRLSKLHKDAAAECNNKMIGRTGLDIDVKRAADELGMNPKDALKLRDLSPGSFYVFGPAISKSVEIKQIGAVKTYHPSAGNRKLLHTPEATDKIKSVLAKLTDLPKEIEKEIQDKASMQLRIAELSNELRRAQKEKPRVSDEEIKDIQDRMGRILQNSLYHELDGAMDELIKSIRHSVDETVKKAKDRFEIIRASIDPGAKRITIKKDLPPKISSHHIASTVMDHNVFRRTQKQDFQNVSVEGATFGICARKILGFLVYRKTADDRYYSKPQIGAMIGYSHKSGSFNNSLGQLSSAGLIERSGGNIRVVEGKLEDAIAIAGNQDHFSLDSIVKKLGKCERAIYDFLNNQPAPMLHDSIPKETIGENIGYSHKSGSFNNALGRLNTLELIVRSPVGIRINPEILNL